MTERPNSWQWAKSVGRVVRWMRSQVRRVRSGTGRWIDAAESTPAVQQGAKYGALVAAMICGGVSGSAFKSPLGWWIDVLVGALLAYLLARLGQLVYRLALAVLRTAPRLLSASGVGAVIVLVNLVPDSLGGLGAVLAAGVVVVEVVFGAALIFVLGKEFRRAGGGKKAAALTFLGLGLAANVLAVYWLVAPGDDQHLVELPASDRAASPPVGLGDPGAPGPYPVSTLTYGRGQDRHRPEFGRDAELTTDPVDATPFVKGFKGWRKTARRWFWGFDVHEFPLNGRVWYPQGEGPFPLVLTVHGNHNMMEFSDPGYAYLGELLASRGFIFVSVDENFLNGSVFGGIPRENDARGWILLKHLETWREWNRAAGNPFAGKVDLDRIGLIGHSRGGEAAAIAAAFNRLSRYPDDATVEFDFGFAIRAVIAIAPSDGQYLPADRPTPLEDVNYLVVQGGHDSDVSLFMGDRQYNRVGFSAGSDCFKASVYVYRANHGQWNTVWGRTDVSAPTSLFLNTRPLLDAEEQRRFARTYFSAFLEATLRGREEYRDLFRDHGLALDWLPRDIYVTRYEDATFRLLAGYEEDVEVTSASVDGGTLLGEGLALWREQDVNLRKGTLRRNHAAYLGWRSEAEPAPGEDPSAEAAWEAAPASYTLSLPAGLSRDWELDSRSRLVLELAASDEKPPRPGDEDGEASGAGDEEDEVEPEGDEEDEESEEPEPEPLDFTVELVTADGSSVGLPLSRFGVLVPPLKMRFSKLDAMEERRYGTQPEAVFQTFELPLAHFTTASPQLDLTELAAVRLLFDRSPQGVVVLDRVGFAR